MPRVRLGRVLIVTFLLSTAALAWLLGPALLGIATSDNGKLGRARRKIEMWVSIAQWKDKRIKNVSKALGGQPPKAKTRP